MKINEELYQRYIEEMEALEGFRQYYRSIYPGTPLDSDDQDIKRLVEALAFFSARTKLSGEKNVLSSRLRIFREYFSYLLKPLPISSMVQAQISPQFVDQSQIPKRTEFNITPQDSSLISQEPKPASFRSCEDLRIFPIIFDDLGTLYLANGKLRLYFKFSSFFPRTDNPSALSLYIDYLNDYSRALALQSDLRDHLENAFIVFGQSIDEKSKGESIEVSFGKAKSQIEDSKYLNANPIEEIRNFFHFPERELFINFDFNPPPRNWSEFTICLDLNESWPKSYQLYPNIFKTHVLPLENIKNDLAGMIQCDGTKDNYPVIHNDSEANFSVLNIKGVYEVADEEVLPLSQSASSSTEQSFEVEFGNINDKGRKTHLVLNLPDAFIDPKKISVDCDWMQTWFSEYLSHDLKANLSNRHLEGVSWKVCGKIKNFRDSEIKNNMDDLLYLLSIKNQDFLNLEDLKFILKTIGIYEPSPFFSVFEALSELKLETEPHAIGFSSSYKYCYQLKFKAIAENFKPHLIIMCQKILALLKSWSTSNPVALDVECPSFNYILSFEEEE